jgi:alpha-amylase
MVSTRLLITALSSALWQTTSAASNADWRGRSVYQVITDRFARTDNSTTATCDTGDSLYCGGSWQGIINRLDYIQGMGFNAVWISPITQQIEDKTAYGYAYHGYWQQDIYSVNSHFGTEADLQSLSQHLHARGMVNH